LVGGADLDVVAEWDDGLKSVLGNNQRSQLVSQWQFPIALREVLTKQNAYFKS
jgi:hypothetical protein